MKTKITYLKITVGLPNIYTIFIKIISIVLVGMTLISCEKIHKRCIDKYLENGRQSNDFCKFIQKDNPSKCQSKIDAQEATSQTISLGLGGTRLCKSICESTAGESCGYYCDGLCEGDYGPIRNPNTTLDTKTKLACEISLEESGFSEIAEPSSAACHRFCLQGTNGGCNEYCGRLCAGDYLPSCISYYSDVAAPDNKELVAAGSSEILCPLDSDIEQWSCSEQLHRFMVKDYLFGHKLSHELVDSDKKAEDYFKDELLKIEKTEIGKKFSKISKYSSTDDMGENTDVYFEHSFGITNGGVKYGYIYFSGFYKKELVKEVSKFSEDYNAERPNFLILDLRKNSGGRLDIAQAILSIIAGDVIGEGETLFSMNYPRKDDVIFSVSREFKREGISIELTFMKHSVSDDDKVRLIILVDRFTASASEIVINTLRAYDQKFDVSLIGEKTQGKPFASNIKEICGTNYLYLSAELTNSNGESEYSDGFSPKRGDQDNDTVHIKGCSVNIPLLPQFIPNNEPRVELYRCTNAERKALDFIDHNNCSEESNEKGLQGEDKRISLISGCFYL